MKLVFLFFWENIFLWWLISEKGMRTKCITSNNNTLSHVYSCHFSCKSSISLLLIISIYNCLYRLLYKKEHKSYITLLYNLPKHHSCSIYTNIEIKILTFEYRKSSKISKTFKLFSTLVSYWAFDVVIKIYRNIF